MEYDDQFNTNDIHDYVLHAGADLGLGPPEPWPEA